MKLSYIFQWDISFALDLRQGDSFALLYEEIYAKGVKAEDGKILAATFVNMGKSYTAVRYRENGKEEFYTPDGMSMRKAFIRDRCIFLTSAPSSTCADYTLSTSELCRTEVLISQQTKGRRWLPQEMGP